MNNFQHLPTINTDLHCYISITHFFDHSANLLLTSGVL